MFTPARANGGQTGFAYATAYVRSLLMPPTNKQNPPTQKKLVAAATRASGFRSCTVFSSARNIHAWIVVAGIALDRS